MKILHIANFGFNKQGAHFYCTDRKISAGLIENGHFVYDFSFRGLCCINKFHPHTC
ncbi:glycosyltransferase [Acinetobacter baumannii]|nr:glycosyltransferase [Acinetobacter baumannii]